MRLELDFFERLIPNLVRVFEYRFVDREERGAKRGRETASVWMLIVRGGHDDAQISAAIAALWSGRDDRYSELRGAMQADTGSGQRRVEMHYIGG